MHASGMKANPLPIRGGDLFCYLPSELDVCSSVLTHYSSLIPTYTYALLTHKPPKTINHKTTGTEKTDGTRYLLYIVEDPAGGSAMAVFQDRNGMAYQVPGGDIIGGALKVRACVRA